MESEDFERYRQQCQVLNERVNNQEKSNIVLKATQTGAITLATRNFGRGTDFQCLDTDVIKAGGLHVIQTFLSEDLSEETQIMGRTARQGTKGSYMMILTYEDLTKFNIEE